MAHKVKFLDFFPGYIVLVSFHLGSRGKEEPYLLTIRMSVSHHQQQKTQNIMKLKSTRIFPVTFISIKKEDKIF